MSPEHIRAEWALCRDWLVPALRDATETEVIEDLIADRAQLWRGDGGAFVTQLINGAEPMLMVWLGGGDLRSLLAMQPGIEAWGRMHGAQAAWINGRRGWARALKRTGFEPAGDELRKAL